MSEPWQSGHTIHVRVHDPETVDRAAMALFGRPLAHHEWADATGAPNGAAVRVVAERDELRVYADHPWFAEMMERRLLRAADRALVCRNARFVLQPWARRQGYGARIFARQVVALERLGVARIEAEIAGGPGSPYAGYYTWARLGFNAHSP
jgi:3-hydroxyacyl-CoA dehydrogenase